jgi:predicted peptidase
MRAILFFALMILSSKTMAAELAAEVLNGPYGVARPYRLAVPAKIEAGKTYPLVLFLHGAGERGNDNQQQLKHGVRSILENAEKLGEPCFLIAPQCEAEQWWSPLDGPKTHLTAASQPNPRLESVLALVAEFSKTHPVDPARFYVTGISMGGFGTWDILGRIPEKIAAALPVCGGGDVKLVSRYKDVPIWTFHGDADPTVPVLATLEMLVALKQAGGAPKFTIYPDVKHDSWTITYANPEVIRWLFDQRKKTP